jgi:hypothetical protein
VLLDLLGRELLPLKPLGLEPLELLINLQVLPRKVESAFEMWVDCTSVAIDSKLSIQLCRRSIRDESR